MKINPVFIERNLNILFFFTLVTNIQIYCSGLSKRNAV